MTRTLLIIGLAFALGACASSNSGVRQASATAQNGSTAATGPGSDVICKSTPMTGSRTMKRVCHTRDEWAQMRRNAEETVRTTQQRPTGHFENQGGGG